MLLFPLVKSVRETVVRHPTLPTSLIGYWKLDESSGTRSDSKGSNNLTANNAPGSRPGVKGSALSNDDTSSQWLSGTNHQSSIGSGSYSISCWIYADDLSHANASWGAGFIKNGTVASGTDVAGAYLASVTTGGAIYWWNWVNDDRVTTNTSPITTGAWHHVVLRWNGTSSAIFVNGASVAVSTGGSTSSGWGIGFEIGRTSTSTAFVWDGGIDEVGVWSKALTNGEISDLYNGGNGISYN